MADVFAVVSLLSDEAQDTVVAAWDLLERRFGLRAAQEASYPHLTYLVGEGGDLPTFSACASAAAGDESPVTIAIDGLGLFPGAAPVLFLRVIHDATLTRVYDRVADAARCAGTALWPHYAAEKWVPHITLALRDLRPSVVPAVLDALRDQPLRLQTTLRDLCLVRVRRPMSESEYVGVYPLGGSAYAAQARTMPRRTR